MNQPLLKTNIDRYPCKHGKVRDVYEINDSTLVIISTDRISAFDWVLPTGIPDKGRILNQISVFWMNLLGVDNHFLSDTLADMPQCFWKKELEDRTMMVRKTNVVPFECIVRAFLTGSGWSEYQHSQMVGGIEMPAGLQSNTQFPRPIFTPSTKEEKGHDLNIPYREMRERCKDMYSEDNGYWISDWVKAKSLEIFGEAMEYAWHQGILIADTKFEWGMLPSGDLLLIDEVLTPDSSRFWPQDKYKLGVNIPSYDKQYVRDYLNSTKWDKVSPPPELPPSVVENTRKKYLEAYTKLTGKEWN